MKRSIRLLFSLCVFAGAAVALSAEPPSYSLGDVTITATRIPEPISASPADVTIITAAQIRASGAQTVAGAIKNVADLAVSTYGPIGSLSTVSIRGSTSGQVLVLVDGVSVDDPLTGTVDLSAIPVDNIARIEIIRSGASALYGTDAIGGVIDIITKRSPKPSLTASLENGAYLPGSYQVGSGATQTTAAPDLASLADTQRASLSATGSLGSVALHAAGSFVRAQNGYLYYGPNDNPRQLQNGDLLGGDGSAGLSFPLLSGTLSADFSGLYHASGVPGAPIGPNAFLTPEARQTQSVYREVLRYSTPHLGSDLLSLDVTAHASQSEVTYVDPSSATNEDHKDTSLGADLQQNASLSDALTLVYGGALSYDRANDTDIGTPTRLTAGAYLEPVISLGSFSLYPAVRYDYYSDFAPGNVSFMLGLSYEAAKGLSLKANLSRSYRAPALNDLYWPASPYAAGNPNLLPESAWSSDIGLRLKRGAITYAADAFARYAQDVILWLVGSNGVYSPSNYELALYPGIDQSLKLDLSDRVSASVSYTFLYSFALSGGLNPADNLRMPMTPVHTVTARLGYEGAPLSGALSARYESLRFIDSSNTSSLPGYVVVDVIGRLALDRSWKLYLAADNLFDAQYQLVAGYPMPPTFVRTGVEARF